MFRTKVLAGLGLVWRDKVLLPDLPERKNAISSPVNNEWTGSRMVPEVSFTSSQILFTVTWAHLSTITLAIKF